MENGNALQPAGRPPSALVMIPWCVEYSTSTVVHMFATHHTFVITLSSFLELFLCCTYCLYRCCDVFNVNCSYLVSFVKSLVMRTIVLRSEVNKLIMKLT